MVIFLVAVFILSVLCFFTYLDNLKGTKEEAAFQLKIENFKNAQSQVPKVKVRVKTVSGDLFETGEFDITAVGSSGAWGYLWLYTSKKNAERSIERFMKEGYYFDKATQTAIPVCNIEKVEIV